MKYFKLKATLILAILLCNISASAYTEIWQNNIKYTLGDDGTAAVNGISRITAAIIPEKVTYDGMEYAVTSIEEYALSFCTSLVSVVIPCSVTSIGDGTFGNCTGLVSVDIPNSVTSIGDNAFSYCTGLVSVDIPYSVTSIGDCAFLGCDSLASVVIPGSVTSIGDGAFTNCNNLKKLVCHATTPPVFADELWGAFVGVNKDACTLYVPQESLDAYKSAAHWKDFFNIATGVKNATKTSSATESERYSTDGTRLASPQKGINIIRMSDGTVKKVLVK